MPDNSERAFFAEEAIKAFRDACATDEEDAIPDLICNLCHLSDARSEDPIANIKRGLYHHHAETHHEEHCVITVKIVAKPNRKARSRASEKLPAVLDALKALLLGIKEKPFANWPHEAIAAAEKAYVDAKGEAHA